jgi:integrase/recombinase XerD
MEDSIDAFIRFLAIERGLSENYQLSTQRSLTEFAQWCAAKKNVTHPRGVTLPMMSEYLAERKRAGLSASSIKLVVVALKIFDFSPAKESSGVIRRRHWRCLG